MAQKDEAAKKSVLFPNGEKIEYDDNVPTIETASINSKESCNFIKEHSPDVICLCGVGVAKPRVFNLAKKGTINIHVGITPEYRSAKPIEWALYNGDYDNVGVTVHFVDEGIDTGDIIYQEKIPVTSSDSIGSIYGRCKISGCNNMLKAISEIENGTIKRWQKDGVSGRKYISHEFGLTNYLRVLKNLKRAK